MPPALEGTVERPFPILSVMNTNGETNSQCLQVPASRAGGGVRRGWRRRAPAAGARTGVQTASDPPTANSVKNKRVVSLTFTRRLPMRPDGSGQGRGVDRGQGGGGQSRKYQ